MFGFRKIGPLKHFKGTPNEPGPVPTFMMLRPSQLIVNEDYQRELSQASDKHIRQMALNWDWASYKALNVVRTEDPDIFEVLDGQHTAYGAATHGGIDFLPCLVMEETTLQRKAVGFLGINRNRLSLNRIAIYYAELTAQEPNVIAVECAMSEAGAKLLAVPPSNGCYEPGDIMAISSMVSLVKRGGDQRLVRILKISAVAKAAPISASLLKALDIALPVGADEAIDRQVTEMLLKENPNQLETVASTKTAARRRVYETLADLISDKADLPEKRLGKKVPVRIKKKSGRKPKSVV